MLPANLLRSYRTVATQTASPAHLVVMLYDGAIRFLERALTGFEFKDPLEFNATINNNVLRAQEILQALDNSLDLEQGGQLALTLRNLYNFMDRQLTLSNARKNPEGIRDTIQRLTTLRESWSQIAGTPGGLAPAPGLDLQASPALSVAS